MRYWGRNQLSRELRPKVAGEEMVEQFFKNSWNIVDSHEIY